jgi:trans-L-3-hydroxyproline dehydratase
VITVVGAHAEGEIGDVITGGELSPPGTTMMEKMAFERQFDHIRSRV